MMLLLFKKVLDYSDDQSITTRFRRKRFALFQALLSRLQRPVSILDVGGTQQFWTMMRFSAADDVAITLLNLQPVNVSLPNFRSVVGDARNMAQFTDQEFGVVFSNSVIEHVGGLRDQQAMASEIRRVGKRYFLQTPNRYFPIEPHFLFPFFQFLPVQIRAQLLSHFDLGWYRKSDSYEAAKREVQSIRLLSGQDLRHLFPEGSIYQEKFWGLTKSFVTYYGWEE